MKKTRGLHILTFTVGHLKKIVLKLLNIITGLLICLEIVCKLVGNLLDILGKFVLNFGGHWCNTNLNKSSCNN